ncbi:MAG TPA: hypothetical protein GX405_17365 [Rhizobiales bacterium]|nr:hypothetical protein [Hyphomicrobiales bacterium]
MASAIVPVLLKRLVSVTRAAAAIAPVLAMLLLPVLHATAEPAHGFAREHAVVLVGKAAGIASDHGSHHAGQVPAKDASHEGNKASGPSCVDLAGCPLHAQIASCVVGLGGSVLTHAVGYVEPPDFRAVSRGADSPPPRSHA